MRLLVARKPDMGVCKQLVTNWVTEGVVLLTDQDSCCVLLTLIVDAFYKITLCDACPLELGARCGSTDKLQILKHRYFDLNYKLNFDLRA